MPWGGTPVSRAAERQSGGLAGLGGLLAGIIEGPDRGWTDPMVLGYFGVAALLLGVFVTHELRSDHPMLDVRLFRRPSFSAAIGAITLGMLALAGLVFNLTQYLQLVRGYSPLEAGARMTVLAAGFGIGGQIAQRARDRFGARPTIVAGLVAVSGILAWFSTVEVSTAYWMIGIALVLSGAAVAECRPRGCRRRTPGPRSMVTVRVGDRRCANLPSRDSVALPPIPGEGPMSDAPRNVELVERLEHAYNERDYDTVRACIAADFVANTPGSDHIPPGVEGAIIANEGSFAMFSDYHTEILEIFGEGDRVVSHVRMTGTNDGDMPGGGIPATGKPVDFDWIQISRHADDGTIVETWAQMDIPKMMTQLGAMPAPEGI